MDVKTLITNSPDFSFNGLQFLINFFIDFSKSSKVKFQRSKKKLALIIPFTSHHIFCGFEDEASGQG